MEYVGNAGSFTLCYTSCANSGKYIQTASKTGVAMNKEHKRNGQ